VLIFTLALRIVGDRELAREVLQDTFLRCWDGREAYDSVVLPLDALFDKEQRGTAGENASATTRGLQAVTWNANDLFAGKWLRARAITDPHANSRSTIRSESAA
jgi:hypothetical protein